MATPLSRVQVLDNPILAPGTCCLCGSAGGDGRKFIDFGKQLDWFGAVYFCSHCIAEVARSIGFIPVAAFDQLYSENRDLQIAFDQLKAKYESMDSGIRSIFGSSYPGHFRNDVSPDEKLSGDVGAVEISEGRNKEADKSSVVEGSDDLFDASDFEH